MNDQTPLDPEELMLCAERIEQLSPENAEWVSRLYAECLRARLHEAELMSAVVDEREPTEAQLAQVALDAAEWLRTLWSVGYMGAGSFPSQPRSEFPLVELEDVLNSALFARIRQGKRPLPFPPPTRNGLPWHDLFEGAEDTHTVDAEIVRDAQGKVLGAIVAGCPHWNIVQEIDGGHEFIVQHRGKGPLFRLLLNGAAVLRREPPCWARVIRSQERAGYRTYQLEWPEDVAVERVPLRAATWERAEAEANHWVAANYPQMYGQIRFERVEG